MGDKVMAFAHIFQSAAAVDGNGMAMDVGGLALVGVQVTGTFSATVTIEGSIDESTWVAVRSFNVATGAVVTSMTAAVLLQVPVAGLRTLRCRISSYASGTITATGLGVMNASGMELTA